MTDETKPPPGVDVYAPLGWQKGVGYGVSMTRCRASVHAGGGWGFHQCARKGVVEEHGYLWCKQHAPSAVTARNAEAQAKRDAETRARDARHARDRTRAAAADTALRYFRQQATHDELEAAVNAYAAALDEIATLSPKES